MDFICFAVQFNGRPDRPAQPDVNGLMPVMLISKNGELPRRARVLAGTVAHNLGIEIGNLYAVEVTQLPDGEYGERYAYQAIHITYPEYVSMAANLRPGIVKQTTVIPNATKVSVGTFVSAED